MLAGVEGDLRTLRNEYPLGFGPACDQAAALARGEHLVLLRPDAVPADGWLEPLVELLDARDRDRRGTPAGGRPARAATTARPSGPAWRSAAPPTSASAASPEPSTPGRAEKATLLERLTVADVPTALMLMVPEDVVLPAAA